MRQSLILLPLVVVLSALPVAAADAPTDPVTAWTGFVARDLGGREWSAASLEGWVVVIDFWATWCAPCLAEIPRLRRLYQNHRQEGLEILGVSLDQTSRRELRRWLGVQEVTWPQFHDGRGFSGELALTFGVQSLPRTFLIDRSGRLVATDLRGEYLEAAVRSLLEIDQIEESP